MPKIVLVTGGFDPLHSGHLSYLKAASELGDRLVVGVNSDAWLTRKKGKPFLPFSERAQIVEAIRWVCHTIPFNDDDGSAKAAILATRRMYLDWHIVFANGGDRTQENIPEMNVDDANISFVFGVGGEDKKNSSSWILKGWQSSVV
jgi:D-beta-D-heptose 7-phosphate kinase/D-beta-D-heptose 1-phosphate adenosyltransferase